MDDYELLDSGDGRKYERFGDITLVRPSAQAIWRPRKDPREWARAAASFDRAQGNRWTSKKPLPEEWSITVSGIRFRLAATAFGHLGIFPEQRDTWDWITRTLATFTPDENRPASVLNLFAYSGGATIAAARAGARVCHVDASKGMVTWARRNAELNGLSGSPIQWIVDDANRFLAREIRRGKKYDGIILDPPTFGHGARKEIYKIEDELAKTMEQCGALLSPSPAFIVLSSHTPYCTSTTLSNLICTSLKGANARDIGAGEMLLTGAPGVLPLPNGTYARWSPNG